MSNPYLALQAGLLAALNGQVDADIYDAVPQGAEYPYITLDRMVASDQAFVSSSLDEVLVYWGVWSRVRGQEEVQRLLHQMYEALHEKRLALADGTAISVRVIRRHTGREPDNETFMGQLVSRVFLHY